MAPPRKEPRMKSYWLKCTISPGQFSGEFVVEAKDFQGHGFSLFVPDSVVEYDDERGGRGWMQVDVMGTEGDLALVRLPRAPLENGPTVTVRTSELDFKPARELA